MRPLPFSPLAAALAALSGVTAVDSAAQAPTRPPAAPRVQGWLNWRGPLQSGVSLETGLPGAWALGGKNDLWSIDLHGRGTPVIANGRLYAWGYRGEGPDLEEVLLCADAATGKKLWEKPFRDYISDIVYDRYALGAPAVDPETGNVYFLTSPGTFSCFTPQGKLLWEHSTWEEFGRMNFPNGRTGAPAVDRGLVILHGIVSNWGAQGAASDRLSAYDKRTGRLVWVSTPGGRPRENSFGAPVFAWQGGKRVAYVGLGDGNVACVNVGTGDPLWTYKLSAGGGINASVLLYKDRVIAVHDAENVDTNSQGRMAAVRVGAEPKPGEAGPVVLKRDAEVWRNDASSFSSSPVLVKDRVYLTNKTGELLDIDANTGKVLWTRKLGKGQLHASPAYGDGKLYVPQQSGDFFILRPSDTGARELAHVKLVGQCLGAPAIAGGRVYIHTTEKLYCFGSKAGNHGAVAGPPAAPAPRPGKAVALQIVPSEVLLRPGEHARFIVRGVDANGLITGSYDSARVKWAAYIPPTAAVRAQMDAKFNSQGELVAGSKPSAGAFQAAYEGLTGTIRGRVVPAPPLKEDFEEFQLAVPHPTETGVKFAYPPLPWIGGRFRWEVRGLDGSKVLAKTLDNELFQRAQTLIGHPAEKNYTLEADVMSDGNRRIMSSVGLINQRYLIVLMGNAQQLEITSNNERLKVDEPFAWKPKVWYRMKTRVDVGADGNGVVRAKVWPRGEAEPGAWTLEVPHKRAHTQGAPGLYGFSPEGKFRVYIDNVSLAPDS